MQNFNNLSLHIHHKVIRYLVHNTIAIIVAYYVFKTKEQLAIELLAFLVQ